MSEQNPLQFFATAEEELAFAKTCVDGMELSPAAQALYEREGAKRFREFHGRRLPRNISKESSDA